MFGPKCSFCGKRREECRKLVAGGWRTYICDACVTLVMSVMARELWPKILPDLAHVDGEGRPEAIAYVEGWMAGASGWMTNAVGVFGEAPANAAARQRGYEDARKELASVIERQWSATAGR
ncbi:MAG: hypothetical protein HY906_20175 [Deltaproteobacteria bacterium]|nr:hypothetical protein [Deltaproteobacteria bacterium]